MIGRTAIRQQAQALVHTRLQRFWARAQRLQPIPHPITEHPPSPITPVPVHTGPMVPVSTIILPMVRLLQPIDVRDTRELVSSAVQWFYERHRCLPTTAHLNPLRCLAIASQAFFPIDCEPIGGYTIEIQQAAHLGCDEVWLSCGWGMIEDLYLCV